MIAGYGTKQEGDESVEREGQGKRERKKNDAISVIENQWEGEENFRKEWKTSEGKGRGGSHLRAFV